MNFSRFAQRRFACLNLPALSLLALLQRTPVVQLAATAENFVLRSPLGTVLKSALAVSASLGAVHSLAGATTLAASPTTSPLNATVGTAIATQAMTVTGAQTIPASFTISGPLPPGLSLGSGATLVTAATALPTVVNGASLSLSGTPTTAGTYNIGIRAWQNAGGKGDKSSNFNYQVVVTAPAATVPAITTQPQHQGMASGSNVMLTVAASGSPGPTFQWRLNGTDIAGATSSVMMLGNMQPGDTGLYTVVATNSAGSVTSSVAIVGLTVTAPTKVVGAGQEVGSNIFVASNGNTFDQVLLNGAAEAITADFDPDPTKNQITRTSYVDVDDDIVQVEFSGPGTLSLVLDTPTGPAVATKYNQTTQYMKGHAGIVITGANEFSNVSVFSVGRKTAVNQALFKDGVTYDGIADIAFIAIATTNGKFGGVRTANANYFAAKGVTGVYAPGVAFQGPVFMGNISAFTTATPVIMLGSAGDVRITGGDLFQDNGQTVQVSGLTQLKFTGGGDSHGNLLPAQANRAVLKQDGNDVTAQVVVNPTP